MPQMIPVPNPYGIVPARSTEELAGVIKAWTPEQQIAFRNIKIKHYLFDLTKGSNAIFAKQPTDSFIGFFATFVNRTNALSKNLENL